MRTYLKKFALRLLVATLIASLTCYSFAQATQTVTYIHTDTSGTPLLETDASGGVVWNETYKPYGQQINNQSSSSDNKLWFAGKPYDAVTKLSYFGSRYYDPVVGRFTGVDPKEVDPGSVYDFNRYSYANNNPYRYVDPDGKVAVVIWLGITFVAVGYIAVCQSCKQQISSGFRAAIRGINGLIYSESDEDKSATSQSNESNGGKSPEITPEDLTGKSREELERMAGEKGLVQDPRKPNRYLDPETGKERLRIDQGHIDPRTGKPYDDERAAVPHAHGYDSRGRIKITDPNADNNPHFPLRRPGNPVKDDPN